MEQLQIEEFTVTVRRSDRKTLGLYLLPEGGVELRCGRFTPSRTLESMVRSHLGWLRKKQSQLTPPAATLTDRDVGELTKLAKITLPPLVHSYARQLGVTVGRITIRHQRTRWGSCSARGNLNFNCLLMLAPPEVQTYVVIHELCHLVHMNHSPAFWAEVAKHCPNYRQHRAWLRKQGSALIRSLP